MKYLARSEELVLLSVWKAGDEAYGSHIRKYLSKMTGKYWSIGSVYVPLDRLELKGLVVSFMSAALSERGGKSRRCYRLTEEGLEKLREIQRINALFWNDAPDLQGNTP